jgi:alpha-glucosidase
MPYLYSAFAEAHTSGMPVSRTLVMDNTYDEKCWYYIYQQQFMFGPSILVAPVESTKEITKVYLPKGQWFDFLNGHQYEGEQEILIECPLDKLPVFAKGGSIIPMQTLTQSTSEKPSDTLFVHVYFGSEASSFSYYEDDGLTYAYEKGNSITSGMTFMPADKKMVIEPLASPTYTSKFKTIALMLHGFESVAPHMRVNGKTVTPKAVAIDLYNSIKPNDPLWFDSRKMEQKILVIDNIQANIKTEISW